MQVFSTGYCWQIFLPGRHKCFQCILKVVIENIGYFLVDILRIHTLSIYLDIRTIVAFQLAIIIPKLPDGLVAGAGELVELLLDVASRGGQGVPVSGNVVSNVVNTLPHKTLQGILKSNSLICSGNAHHPFHVYLCPALTIVLKVVEVVSELGDPLLARADQLLDVLRVRQPEVLDDLDPGLGELADVVGVGEAEVLGDLEAGLSEAVQQLPAEGEVIQEPRPRPLPRGEHHQPGHQTAESRGR